VILGADRRQAHAQAAREGAQLVVLDDSLQSRVRPSLQAAVILARDLMSPPRILPAGPARESMGALARCQLLLVRRESADPPPERLLELAQRHCHEAYVFRLEPQKLINAEAEEAPLSSLKSMGSCLLLSGLARPGSFEGDARDAGAQAVAALRYSDHASFDERRAREIESAASRRHAHSLLCPEKNLARLAALRLSLPLWALRSSIVWEGENPLPAVLRAMKARPSQDAARVESPGESVSPS
jgi:tetraacyldisaccharide-1-P 4'-kinase